ncbi:MAG: hypothetical protein EOS58_23975 [Mesorhizobium sp.]|nr:hypothetical protein EOA33_29500 [Mesorhizobium sp. M4A.F.Ca.ET.050.02.1.1]RVC45318.1 hypothetical protein EN781_10340 [Mesorhizobium sp. M4A.F.Ca.ET.090.04.2.1]RVC78512.1 hypothetical protein EN745_18730 [Mesorhizobium sp. M4A.F.Ca.ET.022.05.2.1]RVD43384.1 hypothetical protein EN742_05160 [Mesorhizobium sp. M4A.F.Ca.ET.020.02.1.1]RWC12807.1 MAG: hypothetical protein EOS53_25150 [Mesorhizobium sp.]
MEGSLPLECKRFKSLNLLTSRFFQHPSSVSALRADPPSPTRGEGKASAQSFGLSSRLLHYDGA